MDLQSIIEKVERYAMDVYKDSKILSHDFLHTKRVVALSLKLGKRLGLDSKELALLEIAAWLHDVAIAKYGTKENHAEKSAEIAELLLDEMLPKEYMEIVVEAIRKHSWSEREKPLSPIGEILQDADRLDALGAVGIYRTIAYGAATGKKFYCEEDPFAKKRELDDVKYIIDHFYTKLLKIPEKLNTDVAREEAEKRIKIMKKFLEELRRELEQ